MQPCSGAEHGRAEGWQEGWTLTPGLGSKGSGIKVRRAVEGKGSKPGHSSSPSKARAGAASARGSSLSFV